MFWENVSDENVQDTSVETSVTLARNITVHTTDVNSCAFTQKYLATCSGDKTVRLFNTLDWKECTLSPLLGHTYYVNCVAFSNSGKTTIANVNKVVLASCSTDGRCILWDTQSGSKLALLEHESKSSLRICRFSPNGANLVTAGDDEKLVLWDVATRKTFRVFEGHEGMITTCSFTPDGTYLISASTMGDIKGWDALYGHGKCLTTILDAHDLGVTGSDISGTHGMPNSLVPDSQLGVFSLATCGNDGLIKLWSVESSPLLVVNQKRVLRGHTSNVMCVVFSHSGSFLASGSGDKSVILWNVQNCERLFKIDYHSRYVTSCAFSFDDVYLATCSTDVAVWKIGKAAPLQPFANVLPMPETALPVDSVTGIDESFDRSFQNYSVKDVADWLTKNELEFHVETFTKNNVDGQELFKLTDNLLETKLGVKTASDREEILRKINKLRVQLERQSSLPDEYLCPITREIMQDPVVAADGYTYEHSAIASWIESGKKTSPMTNRDLSHNELTPNRSLKMLIQRYLQDH